MGSKKKIAFVILGQEEFSFSFLSFKLKRNHTIHTRETSSVHADDILSILYSKSVSLISCAPFTGVKLACYPVTIWLMTQCHYKNHFSSFIGPTSSRIYINEEHFDLLNLGEVSTCFSVASWNLFKSVHSTRVKLSGLLF